MKDAHRQLYVANDNTCKKWYNTRQILINAQSDVIDKSDTNSIVHIEEEVTTYDTGGLTRTGRFCGPPKEVCVSACE